MTASGAGQARRSAAHPRSAQELADSRPADWSARFGLTARGAVYLLMGGLGLLLALGRPSSSTDQKGALAELVSHPYGTVLVVLMAIGFAAYSLWRLSEAAFGVTGDGKRAGPRAQSFARAIVYAFLTFSAVSVLRGSRSSQGSQQKDLTARMLAQDYGQLAVGAVGVLVVAIGLALVLQGVRGTFMRYFRGLPPSTAKVIRWLGRVGTTGRGTVFALVGVLVVSAAVNFDPGKATGIDGALRTLLQQPYGRALAGAAALGLLIFGVYGLAEARYRRV